MSPSPKQGSGKNKDFPQEFLKEQTLMENLRRYYADGKEHRRELTPTQQEPAERIRKAFDGMTCGDSSGYMSGFAEEILCEYMEKHGIEV